MLATVVDRYLGEQLPVPKVSTTLTPSQLDTLCKHIRMNSDKNRIEKNVPYNPSEGALTKGLKRYLALLEKSMNMDLDEI